MFISIIYFILGLLSTGYFCMYAIKAGLTNKFTFFWLLLGVLLICLGLVRLYLKKKGIHLPKSIRIVTYILAGAVVVVFGTVLGMIIFYGNKTPEKGVDYIIVLGAQVKGTKPSYNLATRLDAAYEYLEANPDTKVILSGGQGEGEDISEAAAMAEYLINKGISEDRLILEDKSANTDENLKFSAEYIDDKDASVLIVTNSFHVFRSIRIAMKAGIENVEGLGTDIKWYTVPNLYIREVFAVLKYAVCGQI